MTRSKFIVAAVQLSPVFLDRAGTLEKACQMIFDAASQGAGLIVFPETFIPGYPVWRNEIAPGDEFGRIHARLYATLLDQSVTVPDNTTERLCQSARQAGAYVVMGLNERNTEASNTSIYNTLLYIDPQGHILGKHRKLVPTTSERVVWAQGDGSTLGVFDTRLGRLSGLICWENYMPLARFALYARGVQIYVAPTWDSTDTWIATLRHIAREGRVYVIGCCQAFHINHLPGDMPFKRAMQERGVTWINRGASAIIDPEGAIIAGPLIEQEGILFAEVDLSLLLQSKWRFDVAGHYARSDIFQLIVRTGMNPVISLQENTPPPDD